MNYYGNPYGGFGMTQPTQPQPAPMRTNKIFVTSLEDALNRYAEPNTVMVYRHQDEKYEYEVTTDLQGKKNYRTLVLADYSTVQAENGKSNINTQESEINALKGRIKALEDILLKEKKDDK